MLYNLFENRDFVSVFAVALLAEGVDRNFRDLMENGKLRNFGVPVPDVPDSNSQRDSKQDTKQETPQDDTDDEPAEDSAEDDTEE